MKSYRQLMTVSPFLKGLVVGGAFVAAGLMGYAYGSDKGQNAARRELESQCTVDVSFGSPSFSRSCNFGTVMTGVDDNYVYCSTVSVDCGAE